MYDTLDDQELIARSRKGDAEAFGELFFRHQGKLFRFALKITGHAQAAEDLVQESAVKAYLSIRRFRGESGFTTWLYRVLRNCLIDQKRREKVVLEQKDPPPTAEEEAPEASVLREEEARLIREVLRGMPWELRELLVLREYEQLSYQEMSGMTGLKEGTVKSRLARARQVFAEELAKRRAAGRMDRLGELDDEKTRLRNK